MDRSSTIERLSSYHERVLERVALVETALTQAPDQAIPILARLRWDMARLLREYQLFKYREIFDPIIGLPSHPCAARARTAKRRCQEVSERYQAHVQRWSMTDVGAQWDEYRAETTAMTVGVRTHVDAELREAGAILRATASVTGGRA